MDRQALETGHNQSAEDDLVPLQTLNKRLKLALDEQSAGSETFQSIHRLLRDAKRDGLVETPTTIYSTWVADDVVEVVAVVSVHMTVREGDTVREIKHKADPDLVKRLLAGRDGFEVGIPGAELGRYSNI